MKLVFKIILDLITYINSVWKKLEPTGSIPESGVLSLMLGRGPALPKLVPAVL